jgi:indolepyruvate ferredoxin oxidoreductase beta subunit
MGVVAAKTSFDEKLWQDAIEQCVPPKFLELNRKAFELGKNA